MKYSKLPEAYTSFVWGFRRRACKRRGIYPRGLINGIEKSAWKKVVVALIKILLNLLVFKFKSLKLSE